MVPNTLCFRRGKFWILNGHSSLAHSVGNVVFLSSEKDMPRTNTHAGRIITGMAGLLAGSEHSAQSQRQGEAVGSDVFALSLKAGVSLGSLASGPEPTAITLNCVGPKDFLGLTGGRVFATLVLHAAPCLQYVIGAGCSSGAAPLYSFYNPERRKLSQPQTSLKMGKLLPPVPETVWCKPA